MTNGKLLGHNTDCYGFQKSLFENLNKKTKNALVLELEVLQKQLNMF